MSVSHTSSLLTAGWSFKKGNRMSTSEYLPANDFPTEIHLDLLKNKQIADPFVDFNELSVRWVAEETWTYRTCFSAPADHGRPDVATTLTFGGLDTYASVYLNGNLILESQNMFVKHRVDVTDTLKQDDNNLEIVFESARQKGLRLVEEHKEHRFIVHQTEISRGPVRKAQYHWGWDWGPILMACGSWKPIILETFTSKISDIWVEYDIDEYLNQVEGKVFVAIEGSGTLRGDISKDGGAHCEQLEDFQPTKAEGVFSAEFEIPDASLWWPRGYGSQPLYRVSISLSPLSNSRTHDTILDKMEKTVGFRKVKLVQEPDSHGTSFYFRINNVDIFCGGSCWVPSDSFLTRCSASMYHARLRQAAEGNQVMIRVWGGGIYESDAFYEATDQLGLLVWQDFAFACANYPAHPEYLESVETEARQNVRRLRNHPSLIIWAGNNEDYQIVERYNLEYNFTEDKDPQSWLKTNFPARYIYEYLLPKIVSSETKGIPYHPSSPFGNGTSTTLKVDATVGDIHQWNVWHGTMEPYQNLPQMGGRFVSEFGMEAYPHTYMLDECITDKEERHAGSMSMDFRNKAIGHERRIISYVAENFRMRLDHDLEDFTHLTQVMQADALSWAYKSWRRDWNQVGNRKCGGVLVWQLNDCWPTMSWAVVDYHGVPKPGFYAIKRALEPLTISVQRKVGDWTKRPADKLWQRDTSHIDMRTLWQNVEFDVWVANNMRDSMDGYVTVRFVSIKTGKEVLERIERAVRIGSNGTTEVLRNEKVSIPDAQVPDKPFDMAKCDPFVIHATLSAFNRQVASDISWPEPIKYLNLTDRKLGTDIKFEYPNHGRSVVVSVLRPVKGFVFAEKKGIKLRDNGFDLVPGEEKEVWVDGEGCSPADMKARWVGCQQ